MPLTLLPWLVARHRSSCNFISHLTTWITRGSQPKQNWKASSSNLILESSSRQTSLLATGDSCFRLASCVAIAALVSSLRPHRASGRPVQGSFNHSTVACVSAAADGSRRDRDKGTQKVPLAEQLQCFFSVRNRKFWDFLVCPRTYFVRRWAGEDCRQAFFSPGDSLWCLSSAFFFQLEGI